MSALGIHDADQRLSVVMLLRKRGLSLHTGNLRAIGNRWHTEAGESKRVKISVHRKIGNLARGNQVTLYLSKKTPVYEWDGNCMVCGYYALEAQSEEEI